MGTVIVAEATEVVKELTKDKGSEERREKVLKILPCPFECTCILCWWKRIIKY